MVTEKQDCVVKRLRVLHGPVVEHRTHELEVKGLGLGGSTGFFCGLVLVQDTSESWLSTGEAQEIRM